MYLKRLPLSVPVSVALKNAPRRYSSKAYLAHRSTSVLRGLSSESLFELVSILMTGRFEVQPGGIRTWVSDNADKELALCHEWPQLGPYEDLLNQSGS